MFGRPSEEIVGEHFSTLVAGGLGSSSFIFDEMVRSASGGAACGPNRSVELNFLRKDGTEFSAEFHVSPLSIGDQKFNVLFIRDISMRKKMEDELRKLSKAVEQSPSIVIITDVKGDIEYVNPRFTQVTGYSPDEVLGKNPRILKSGETAPAVYQRMWETIMSGQEWRGELYDRKKDGTCYWASTVISPIKSPDGEITHFLGTQEDITQIKKAEAALRESERKYKELVERSNSIIFKMSYDGTILSFNEFAEKFFGFSREELVGRNVIGTIVPPFDSTGRDLRAMIGGILSDPEKYASNVNENVTKDGTRVWIHWSNTVIKDEAGRPSAILCVGNDITQQKKAEEALRQSEERFRLTFENAAVGMALSDLEGRYVKVNRAMCSMLGYSEEEMLSISFQSISHPEDLQRNLELRRMLDEGKIDSFQMEKRYYSKDGQVVWTVLSVSALRNGAGRRIYDLAQLLDITPRKIFESELKKSEERFRALFDESPIALFEEDYSAVKAYLDGVGDVEKHFKRHPGAVDACASLIKLVGANRAAMKLYEAENAGELPQLFKLSDPGRRAHFASRFLAFARGATEHTVEVRSKTLRGKPIFLSLKAMIVPGTNNWERVIVAVQDITALKEAEAELRKYSSALEARVEERTKELEESHRRLLQAERLAAIGSLAAQVGHDLRNPLTTINTNLYYLDRILPKERDDRVKESMAHMSYAVRHANKIVEDLVEYSRQAELKKVRLQLRTVVLDAVDSVPTPNRVKLTVRVPSYIFVDGDASRLVRVFQNLFSNAIDAMPKGGRLTVSSQVKDGFVVTKVADTGVGMTKQQMGRLFTPLYTTKAQGLGMGLAIVKRLVEGHGGRISAQSVPGKGTTFTIVLPLAARRAELRRSRQDKPR